MFNKIFLINIFLIFNIGCNLSGNAENLETQVSATPPIDDVVVGEYGFSIGDKVVALWSENVYYEGTVEGVYPRWSTIKWSNDSQPQDIGIDDIYLLPKSGVKPDVKVGDFVLAKFSEGTIWKKGQIEEIDGDIYAVFPIEKLKKKRLKANEIISMSKADSDVALIDNDLVQKASSKRPKIPADYKPKKGEKILALYTDNHWWSGRVETINDDLVTVDWEDGSTPTDIDKDRIIPQPNSSNTKMPTAGQYVLAKPESGTQWIYAKTVKAENGQITVKDSNGKNRTLKTGEVIPLN